MKHRLCYGWDRGQYCWVRVCSQRWANGSSWGHHTQHRYDHYRGPRSSSRRFSPTYKKTSNLYSTLSPVFIYTVWREQGLERTLVLFVSDCMSPFRSSLSSFPSCAQDCWKGVSGPAARSPPSSDPPHSPSGTRSCCSSGRTYLQRRTSGYTAGMQSNPDDKRSPWLSWPSRTLG